MSFWGPSPQHVEPTDAITISRALAPQEAEGRQLAVRRAALWPLLGYVFGGAWVLLVLMVGLVTGWESTPLIATSAVWLAVIAISLAIALPLGGSVARRQARFELGLSGVLTVSWSDAGVRMQAENFSRSAFYSDIRWVRHVDGFVLLRFPMTFHPSHYLVALPADFVPPEAMQRIAAAGGRIS